jgi:cyclic pyranopterin monophosphate synthase
MATDAQPDAVPGTGSPDLGGLSHLQRDATGTRAAMVDIGAKALGPRRALARARVTFPAGQLESILRLGGPKGPIEEVARLAGIQAAKRTAELIPLCHPLALDHVDVRIERSGADQLVILASASCRAATGVEMEALTAAAVAALTVYDMVKGAIKDVRIEALELLEKDGGKSGPYRAPDRG